MTYSQTSKNKHNVIETNITKHFRKIKQEDEQEEKDVLKAINEHKDPKHKTVRAMWDMMRNK